MGSSATSPRRCLVRLLLSLGFACALAAPASLAGAQSKEKAVEPAPKKTKAKAKPKVGGDAAKVEGSATASVPPPVASVSETTQIQPRLTYRASSLLRNKESPYWDPKYKDSVDQLYVTIRFARTYDFRHDVVIEPSFRTIRDEPSRMDEPVLEQAYVDSAIWKNLALTAGKKTEYDGSGFMVNPSDLLNEDKDLFDPLYQQEGRIFMRLRNKWDNLTVGVGFVPQRASRLEAGRGWLQFGAGIADVDLKLQAMHQGEGPSTATANVEAEKLTVGLSASRYFGERFELHWDGRYMTRKRDAGKSGELWRSYSSYQDKDDASGYYVAGTRVVLTSRRTIILEAIQQQAGLTPKEMKLFHTDLRDKLAGNSIQDIPTRLEGRRYAFFSYQDDDTIRTVHLGASYLTNLLDQSFFANINGTYHLSPISSLELGTILFNGSRDSEFGAMPFPRALNFIFRGKF